MLGASWYKSSTTMCYFYEIKLVFEFQMRPMALECGFVNPNKCPLWDLFYHFGIFFASWNVGLSTKVGQPHTWARISLMWSDCCLIHNYISESTVLFFGNILYIQALYSSTKFQSVLSSRSVQFSSVYIAIEQSHYVVISMEYSSS